MVREYQRLVRECIWLGVVVIDYKKRPVIFMWGSGYRELYLWHDNGFNNLGDIEMIKAGIVAVRKIKGVFNPKRRVDIDLQVIKETKAYGD